MVAPDGDPACIVQCVAVRRYVAVTGRNDISIRIQHLQRDGVACGKRSGGFRDAKIEIGNIEQVDRADTDIEFDIEQIVVKRFQTAGGRNNGCREYVPQQGVVERNARAHIHNGLQDLRLGRL